MNESSLEKDEWSKTEQQQRLAFADELIKPKSTRAKCVAATAKIAKKKVSAKYSSKKEQSKTKAATTKVPMKWLRTGRRLK